VWLQHTGTARGISDDASDLSDAMKSVWFSVALSYFDGRWGGWGWDGSNRMDKFDIIVFFENLSRKLKFH